MVSRGRKGSSVKLTFSALLKVLINPNVLFVLFLAPLKPNVRHLVFTNDVSYAGVKKECIIRVLCKSKVAKVSENEEK